MNRSLAIAFTVLCALGALFSINDALLSFAAMRLYVWLVALTPGVAVAAACAGAGSLFTRPVAGSLSMTERLTLSLALGLGVIAAVVGLAGFTVGLPPWGGMIIILVGLLMGLPLWRAAARRLAELLRQPGSQHTPATIMLVAAISVTALMVLAIALTPPALFDVTEYHLGPWWEYSRTGWLRFTPQPHNLYARFPFPMEALYYLGLLVTPSVDTAPKVLNAICVLACGALVAGAVRRAGAPRPAPLLALLAALTLPVMLDVSLDAMIDAPVALLVGSALVMALLHGSHCNGSRSLPAMTPAWQGGLSMLLMASAITAKYTVAQIYLLPWLLVAAPVLWAAVRQRLTVMLLLAIPAAAMAAVWFGKNVVLYGNPLEPFFTRIFQPGDHARALTENFYIESHYPQSPISPAYWATLLPRLHQFTWIYLAAALIGWSGPYRRNVSRGWLFCAAAFILWNTVRESPDRFLLPAMLIMVILAILGIWSLPGRSLRRVAAAAVMVFSVSSLTLTLFKIRDSGLLSYILDFAPGTDDVQPGDEPTPREAFHEAFLGDLGKLITKLHRLPDADNQRVALIFEARPYLFRPAQPENFPGYNVVWEETDLLLQGADESVTSAALWTSLRQRGYTHVVINRQELLRYIQQYARPAHLKEFGLPPGTDPRMIWPRTDHPESLYPPFYRSPLWKHPQVASAVHEFLAEADARAIIREGPPGKGLDIIVAPVN